MLLLPVGRCFRADSRNLSWYSAEVGHIVAEHLRKVIFDPCCLKRKFWALHLLMLTMCKQNRMDRSRIRSSLRGQNDPGDFMARLLHKCANIRNETSRFSATWMTFPLTSFIACQLFHPPLLSFDFPSACFHRYLPCSCLVICPSCVPAVIPLCSRKVRIGWRKKERAQSGVSLSLSPPYFSTRPLSLQFSTPPLPLLPCLTPKPALHAPSRRKTCKHLVLHKQAQLAC